MKRVDLGIGIVSIVLGIIVILTSQDLASFAGNGPGPGFLPRALALIFILGGLALAIKEIIRPSTETLDAVGLAGNVRVLYVFTLLIVVAVIFEPLGFIVAMLLLMAGLVFGLERKFNLAAILTVVLVPVVCWTLFAVLLRVRLPEGILFF